MYRLVSLVVLASVVLISAEDVKSTGQAQATVQKPAMAKPSYRAPPAYAPEHSYGQYVPGYNKYEQYGPYDGHEDSSTTIINLFGVPEFNLFIIKPKQDGARNASTSAVRNQRQQPDGDLLPEEWHMTCDIQSYGQADKFPSPTDAVKIPNAGEIKFTIPTTVFAPPEGFFALWGQPTYKLVDVEEFEYDPTNKAAECNPALENIQKITGLAGRRNNLAIYGLVAKPQWPTDGRYFAEYIDLFDRNRVGASAQSVSAQGSSSPSGVTYPGSLQCTFALVLHGNVKIQKKGSGEDDITGTITAVLDTFYPLSNFQGILFPDGIIDALFEKLLLPFAFRNLLLDYKRLESMCAYGQNIPTVIPQLFHITYTDN